MASFSKCKENITEFDIDEVEQYVGLQFPKTYREHLLKFNGGQCDPNVFSFVENGKNTQSAVHWFYAIHNEKIYNLSRKIEILKIDEKRMPTHILPIAGDELGNCICISCGTNDNGFIYFWDHEKEVDYSKTDDSDYSNLYFIANDLITFINSLYHFDE